MSDWTHFSKTVKCRFSFFCQQKIVWLFLLDSEMHCSKVSTAVNNIWGGQILLFLPHLLLTVYCDCKLLPKKGCAIRILQTSDPNHIICKHKSSKHDYFWHSGLVGNLLIWPSISSGCRINNEEKMCLCVIFRYVFGSDVIKPELLANLWAGQNHPDWHF